MNLDRQVLYIAAAGHLLPLREKSVDIYVDLTTNEYAMFRQGFAMDALTRYFHESSRAVGVFWHFDGRCESLRELRRQYPDAFDRNFDVGYFRDYLESRWEEVLDFDYLGFVTDSGEGDSFSYHVTGERLNLSSYFVKNFQARH